MNIEKLKVYSARLVLRRKYGKPVIQRIGVWRAIERGESLSCTVERAFNAHYAASMAFNRAIGRG